MKSPNLLDDVKTVTISPITFCIDPKATHLYKRWWHKFVFWKKFVYPEVFIYRKSNDDLENN